MKEVYFSSWWDIHDGRLSRTGTANRLKHTNYFASGRSLFGDWGRSSNFAIDDNFNSFSQSNTENILSYDGASFNYFKKDVEYPNNAEYPNNIHLFIANRKTTLSTYNYSRDNIERYSTPMKKKYKGAMEIFNESVFSGDKSLKELNKKSNFISPYIEYLVDKRPDLLSKEKAELATKLSSPIYSGGCLKTIELKDSIYIIFCDGYNLSTLTIRRWNFIDNSLEITSINELQVSAENEPIYQIDVKSYKEYSDIIIRLLDCIILYRLSESENKIVIKKITSFNSMEQFISCKLDSNFEKEIAITNSDEIKIYDTERNKLIWNKDMLCYSSVIDKWNELQSTTIPKTWLLTNRSNSYHYDCRINPFKSSIELFNTSSESLSRNECFYHATNIFQNYYYYIFSTFNAILVDLRCPQISVNQWTMPLMSPASYSSIDILSQSQLINIVAGCQLDSKHVVFQQHTNNHSKSTSLSSQNGVSIDAPMSLGLTTHFNENKNVLSTLTLDNNANIIGQRYKVNKNIHNYHELPIPIIDYCQSTKRLKPSIDDEHFFESLNDNNDYNEMENVCKDSDYQMIRRFIDP